MAARRSRSTERGISNYEELLDAIKEIKVKKKSVQSTAKFYNIDRKSLGRYVKKFDLEVPDITQVDDEALLKILRRIASYQKHKMVRRLCLYFD